MAIHKSELNTAAVEVQGISKRFGDERRPHRLMPWRKAKKARLALDRVSLHVDTGRITGILGANGSGGDGTRDRVEAMLERLGLPLDTLDKPMKQLSRGQQQKVAIARSFLTSPSLLLMDEPTTGLDPRSKREVQELVRSIRRDRAATVLLCTHDLQEAEVLCDRVVVIDQGRVLADGTPAELIRMHAGNPDGSLEDAFMALTGKRLEEDEEEKDE